MIKKYVNLKALMILGIFIFLIFSETPVSADLIPVVPLNGQSSVFTPTINGNSSLYLVQPGFNGSGLTYAGKPSNMVYTTLSGNSISSSSPQSVTDGAPVPNGAATPAVRANQNPFFPAEQMPVLVNDSINSSSILSQQPIQLNIHMGHSLTFFFNQTIQYYAVIDTINPFFLDVNVINPTATINIDLANTTYPASSSYALTNKMTIPIIPKNQSVQAFKIFSSTNPPPQNSLVTITPLPFDASSFGSYTVNTNEQYSGSIKQGQCYNLQKTSAYDNNLKILDLKFFQFPVTAGNTYQIYFYKNQIYDNYGSVFSACQLGSLNAVSTDQPSAFTYQSGSFNGPNGLVIHPKSNGYANISLIAKGLVYQDYSFYFKENNQFKLPKQNTLPLNQPVSLKDSPNNYYTFNLTQPSMMAINYTSSMSISGVGFNWSVFNPVINDYSLVSNSKFNAKAGNIYNGTNNDFLRNELNNFNWVYLPVGQYRLDVTGVGNLNGKFEFNVIHVQTFTNKIDLTMNPSSVYALQVPLNKIDYNYLNATTTAHDNVSVTYEYGIIGKYSFFSQNNPVVPFDDNVATLGNRQVNGNWTAYNLNQTSLEQYYAPTQTNFVPILMIHPQSALAYNNNNTVYSSYNYSTTLTITSNVNTSYNKIIGSMNPFNHRITPVTNIGFGAEIPNSNSITNQESVDVNSDQTTNQYQLFAFRLQTNLGQLYNLTLFLNGNTTNTTSLNANFVSNNNYGSFIWVHSGNYLGTTVFNERFSRSTNESDIYSLDFLSLSSESYLFVSVQRYNNGTFNYNSTLQISLTHIPVKNLDLYTMGQNFTWNSTISNYELKNTQPLWNITGYTYPGSSKSPDLLVPLLVVTGLVIIVGAGAGTVVYVRKRRS